MSQPSVASYFNTRKRHAAEDINLVRPKILNLGQEDDSPLKPVTRTRSGRTIKRIASTDTEIYQKSSRTEEASVKPKKLVEFIKKGNLSPVKRATPKKSELVETTAFSSKESANNIVRGNKSKNANLTKEEIKGLVRKELKFDEVKTKVSRSEKLKELKSSLSRIKELDKTRKAQEEINRRLREGEVPVKSKNVLSLKEFKTIDLEVLTSPKKGLKTPTKVIPPTPDKNELMSQRTEKPKRVLFSPSKDGSPSKLVVPPAYQKFLNLVETSKTKLTLPYKYRYLIEMFRALDSVCVMFHNRKEVISFKKVKPAVQRIIRKNFHESHLAQIKHLYPEAFNFQQVKMRNFGSVSKTDYYQLIITPNVESILNTKNDEKEDSNKSDDTNIFPQEMVDRLQKFENILLSRVFDAHDAFLKSLDPPLIISKEKVLRWHPEFDLENCPDVELGHIPQPPNVEKFSSARDILSTARNLFNCATPMERALKRLEEKNAADKITSNERPINKEAPTSTPEPVESLLKGVPKSLLEKIRAKQAAKAYDEITRRPSQDEEATNYSRLPALARHLRNVFITEKKGVLPLGIVIKKIDNSYRTSLRHKEIEQLLQLIAKECPDWISFHEIRDTMYLKLAKDNNLGQVIEKLENIANQKAK